MGNRDGVFRKPKAIVLDDYSGMAPRVGRDPHRLDSVLR
jgi:hypothetical protein